MPWLKHLPEHAALLLRRVELRDESAYDRSRSEYVRRTFALGEHLNASANSGMLRTVPSTRYLFGEWGSVRTRATAASGLMFCAQARANEIKNSCSLCVRQYSLRSAKGERPIPGVVQTRKEWLVPSDDRDVDLRLPGTVRLDESSVTNVLA